MMLLLFVSKGNVSPCLPHTIIDPLHLEISGHTNIEGSKAATPREGTNLTLGAFRSEYEISTNHDRRESISITVEVRCGTVSERGRVSTNCFIAIGPVPIFHLTYSRLEYSPVI